jgi:Polyketide cyclase / dehydrase and lipid transport
MKYSDCPTVSVSLPIAAPASTVWDLVSDISLPTRFSSEIREVVWLGDNIEPAVGARFVGRSAHEAIGTWETECEVTVMEPDRCFEYVVGTPEDSSSTWRFTILPPPDEAGVVLEQWFQMGPARSGLNYAIDAMPDKEERIVERRMAEHRTNMMATLEGVKGLAEAVRR